MWVYEDTNYRNAVREISTLAIRKDASHKHILKTVQKAVQDKSELIKSLMEDIVSVELTHLEGETKVYFSCYVYGSYKLS